MEKIDQNIIERKKKASSRILLKIIVINVVSGLLIIAIFVLLNKLSDLGEALKEIRSERFVSQGESEVAVLQSEIEKNREKIERLESLYLDKSSFADFIGVLNTLQTEGVITRIILSGEDPILNSKKQLGYPINLVLEGTEEQINTGLERIYAQPVLFSTINSEIEIGAERAVLRLNIFLLTDEQFSQN